MALPARRPAHSTAAAPARCVPLEFARAQADWTLFAIRPMLSRRQAADAPVGVDAYVFRSGDGRAASPSADGSWIPHCADEPLTLSLDVGYGGSRALVLSAGRAERLRVRLHADLQYTVLQDAFVSCYAEDGTAFGFHFHSAEQQAVFTERLGAAIPDVDDGSLLPPVGMGSAQAGGADGNGSASALAQMVDARAEASSSLSASPTAEQRIGALAAASTDGSAGDAGARAGGTAPESAAPPLVWVLNLVCTRKDRRIRRGAEVKAIAVATTDRFLHAYKVRHAHPPAQPCPPLPAHALARAAARTNQQRTVLVLIRTPSPTR